MVRITDQIVQNFEEEHIESVRKSAAECTLLLRKDGALPLEELCNIALYGSGARKTIKGGTGSGDVNVRHFTTVEEGLKKAGFTITSQKWLDSFDQIVVEEREKFIEKIKKEAVQYGVNPMVYSMGKNMPTPEYNLPMDADANVALYILSRNSGEGSDRMQVSGDVELSQTEIRDINYLNETYEKFVLVLNTGGMVNIEPVSEVKNILLLGQLGTPTGDVLADLLLGKSYPSGKLAMTWAPISNYPSTQGFGELDDTYYQEGIYVGYRYFDTANVTPIYPFGFGLSYTDFKLEPVDTEENSGDITVSIRVTNIGNWKGKEVVQLYYSAPKGKLEKPNKELVGFSKTKELEPGESEIVQISFAASDMASYDTEQASYLMERGNYILKAGNSSNTTKEIAVISLAENVITQKLKNICPGWNLEELSLKKECCIEKSTELENIVHIELSPASLKHECVHYSEQPGELISKGTCSWQEVIEHKKSLDEFVAGLNSKQLTYVCMGLFDENGGMGSMVGSAAKSVAGAAGETTLKLAEFGVPTLTMADGPAGIRICKEYKLVDGMPKGLDNPLAGMMEFADEETLQQMSAMIPQPSKEELEAEVNYSYCTAIPIGTSLAQSWNEEVCIQAGDIVGKEMEMFGIHLWLAPAMNIQRNPLCGRNFEYYSEDPVVSGIMASGITKGVQKHKGCGTTIKHFAANNQETNRLGSNSIVSERALREIFLKGFEICIKNSMPESVMSSYNLVNGEHTNNSKDLITHVLRDEWGFDGIVMTDWYAADDMMNMTNPRKNKNVPGYASGCIHAGNDLIMPGIVDEFQDIQNALLDQSGLYPITLAELQNTAKRVLRTIQKLS